MKITAENETLKTEVYELKMKFRAKENEINSLQNKIEEQEKSLTESLHELSSFKKKEPPKSRFFPGTTLPKEKSSYPGD